MTVSFSQMHRQFLSVLLKNGFDKERADLCARIFAENSRDGVSSHGLNRFPVFIKAVQDGLINMEANPEKIDGRGCMEFWEGHMAPGMYNATLAMDRAITLAKENGMGCVAIKNTNHWMRGGTYGWQAADAGCIGICMTNTIANMPPWGGSEPRLGNNPMIIAVPRKEGHLVLDMALSQFSYGKLQEYELSDRSLPVAGGYDEKGNLSVNAAQIRATQRTLPIGFWKGSGLSFMMDVLVAALSNGRSVAQITAEGSEKGLSQLFICLHAPQMNQDVIEEIIAYSKSSQPIEENGEIFYPGERTLRIRKRNDAEGIPVMESIWKQVLEL